ncbi:Uncharacterized conserved protein [Pseudomonas putida]|nr:Uncharacterized conserved protein [Pseudomonas putida]CAB5588122.1 Uncharacterized conserved protein [Pseudomonas putida]CAB5628532.1 Uncharacterized conserved protein [Pseudomonas putida]CAB5629006.1 Uncharacterized conserved protein [Pseudomonas putida]CAB5705783.1 Uncharacterized conserved protein [Pseudomonas putida]
MSLSKEALQLIGDQALAAAGKTLDTHTPTVLVPDSAAVLDLERYQSGRSRFRGTYSTHSLADYSAYVVERAAPAARGFIDQDNMTCIVLFNLGTPDHPGHADDRAILRLKASAAFAAVQAVCGQSLVQKSMSDWIEDWNQHLSATDENGQTMTIAKAIAAVRTITVKASSESDHAVGETRASRSTMDQIEASSKETLPAWLDFKVIPFEGLGEQVIRLRVSVITGGSQPVLKLRWIGEEAQREAIAQEFKSVLDAKIGTTAKLSLGTFDAK